MYLSPPCILFLSLASFDTIYHAIYNRPHIKEELPSAITQIFFDAFTLGGLTILLECLYRMNCEILVWMISIVPFIALICITLMVIFRQTRKRLSEESVDVNVVKCKVKIKK